MCVHFNMMQYNDQQIGVVSNQMMELLPSCLRARFSLTAVISLSSAVLIIMLFQEGRKEGNHYLAKYT